MASARERALKLANAALALRGATKRATRASLPTRKFGRKGERYPCSAESKHPARTHTPMSPPPPLSPDGPPSPGTTAHALYGQAYEARRWAGVLQRRFQAHFYKSGTEPHPEDLTRGIGLLRRVRQDIEADVAKLDADARATPEGRRLASAVQRLRCESDHLCWYGEDYQHNHERVQGLLERVALAEARAAALEQRNEELRGQLDEKEEEFVIAARDNLRLRDEKQALEAWNVALKEEATHSGNVELLRAELRKYQLCAARESVSAHTQVRVLIDGDDAEQAKALRVLRGHAQRKPHDVIEVDGALAAVLKAVTEDADHAVDGTSILVAVAEADGLALFERVPDLGSCLHELCRDADVRKAALPQLARLLRLLTMRSGGGVLDTKEQLMEFASCALKLWRDVAPEHAAMRNVVGAIAHLLKIDARILANDFIAERLVSLLNGPAPCVELLVALRMLASVPQARTRMLEKQETLLTGLVACLRGTGEAERPVRIEAAKALVAMAEGDRRSRDLVLGCDPFSALFKMAACADKDEYEEALRAIETFMADDDFCQTVVLVDEFLQAVVERLDASDVAFSLFAALLLHASNILEAYDQRCDDAKLAFVKRVQAFHPQLLETLNRYLFCHEKPERRLRAVQVIAVFASTEAQATKMAAVFLPGVVAYMSTANTRDARRWGVTAAAQMAAYADPLTLVEHPGLLKALIRLMLVGQETAGDLLVQLTQDVCPARAAGESRGLRVALLNVFALAKHPLYARDCAALTLGNLYDTGDFDDRDLIAKSAGIMRAIYDMSDYRAPNQGADANGALRLARYLRHKQRRKA